MDKDLVPGGRYTQVRNNAPAKNGSWSAPVMVWNANGDGAYIRPGLRLGWCLTPDCQEWNVSSLDGLDADPRFIRMELQPDNSPLMTFGAANCSELHLVLCSEDQCTQSAKLVLGSASRVRHPDLLVPRASPASPLVAGTLCSEASCELRLFESRLRSLPAPPLAVRNTLIDRSTPFGIDPATGLPTGGLEMPALAELEDGSVALAYWHVSKRSLKLVFDATNAARRRTLTVAIGASGTSSSPGAWVRAAASAGELVLFYFDLPNGELLHVRCSQAARACGAPSVVDATISQRDVSDFGAGGFPELRTPPASFVGRGYARGPAYVYATQAANATGTAPAGELRGVFCADAGCTDDAGWTRRVLARGGAGFGRDASLMFADATNHGPRYGPGLVVTFLDLQGQDTPAAMVPRLALFEQKKGASLVEAA